MVPRASWAPETGDLRLFQATRFQEFLCVLTHLGEGDDDTGLGLDQWHEPLTQGLEPVDQNLLYDLGGILHALEQDLGRGRRQFPSGPSPVLHRLRRLQVHFLDGVLQLAVEFLESGQYLALDGIKMFRSSSSSKFR